MARRSSKADTALIVLLVVVGIPMLLIGKVIDSIGGASAAILVVAILGATVWYQQDKKKRLEYLQAKYGDESVVQKILDGYVWQGQSEEQLEDSMGSPVAIDRNVLKTKTKEIWKYNQQGANRFGLRVTVENGYVVGWDKKA